MIVCIAEKPSVARDIANVLGATRMCQGYLEGNGYQVTWTFGHLCELKEPHEYTPRWKRWDIWDLPMIPPRYNRRHGSFRFRRYRSRSRYACYGR